MFVVRCFWNGLNFSLELFKETNHLRAQLSSRFSYCYYFYIFREADITKERIQKILGAGANVVLVSGGIDDLCLKYFVEAGAMGVRRCKKGDLKRIARATGGKWIYHSASQLALKFLHDYNMKTNIYYCNLWTVEYCLVKGLWYSAK